MRRGFAHWRFTTHKNLRAGGLVWMLLGGPALPAFADPNGLTHSEPAGERPIPAPALSREESSLFALPTTRDHIGRVVVAVTVNGKGPFRFIVDTGATHSTITPELARALGLKPAEMPAVLLNGITGAARVSAVTLDRLQTGDLIVDGLLVPVVGSQVMVGADGIFGAAGLTDKSLSVDFLRNRVEISGAVKAAVRAQALRLHATRLTHGLMVVPLRVGEGSSAIFIWFLRTA